MSSDAKRGAGSGSFADLIGDDPATRRLDDAGKKARRKIATPATPAKGKRRPVRASADASPPKGRPAEDAQAAVFRGDVPPKQFRALRSGQVRAGARIDLHRLDRDQAHHALRKAFGVASAEGKACVLVIHGRGRRSPGGEATLKSALPGWLRSPPLDAWVRAFAPARPRDGGDGATYVLLRTRRTDARR